MRNPSVKTILLGLACALVLVAPASASRDWNGWMERYYQNPDADKLVPAVYALSQSGQLEAAGQPARTIGFLAAVFAQHPDRVDGWLLDLRDLPVAHRRLVAAALWYSGSPRGQGLLRDLARESDPGMRASIESLIAGGAVPLAETPVLSKSSLDLQWGAFLADGEAAHVRNIFAALGSGAPELTASVRLALAEKALAHPRVYEICQAEIARQPSSQREELRTALLGHTP